MSFEEWGLTPRRVVYRCRKAEADAAMWEEVANEYKAEVERLLEDATDVSQQEQRS